MTWALYASFRDCEQAERTVGSLLELGINPEDISLIAQLRDKVSGEVEIGYEPALEMVDAGQAQIPMLRLGSPAREEEGSDHLESHIGGGISTDRPDDDVSGPEELDDAESISEDMFQPVNGRSFSSEEFRDADAFAKFGTLNPFRRRIHKRLGRSSRPEISIYAAPGLLILGDGPLALTLLERELRKSQETQEELVRNSLWRNGVSPHEACILAQAIPNGGAVLSIIETIGVVPFEVIEMILERSQAENICRFITNGLHV